MIHSVFSGIPNPNFEDRLRTSYFWWSSYSRTTSINETVTRGFWFACCQKDKNYINSNGTIYYSKLTY